MALVGRLYPDCESILLTDRETAAHLDSLPFRFAKVRVEPIPARFKGNAVRSRYLKTRMRQIIGGDFLFLDADALPLRRFDRAFAAAHGAPFAAALDRNREWPEPTFPEWVKPYYDHFGWRHPLEHYFNSGVMFMADSPAMRALSERWHQNWLALYEKFGVHQDQPSLNHSLRELKVHQHVLPAAYNAMVDASPYFTRGAKIVHFFLRGDERCPDPASLLHHLVRHLRETNSIDWDAVERAATHSDAWMHPTTSIHIELATHHYLRALKIAASRVFQLP